MKLSRGQFVSLAAVAVSLFVVSGAGAKISPTLSTGLYAPTANIPGYATGVTPETPLTALGAHADYEVDLLFNYGATELTDGPEGPVEDPASYPPGSSYSESIRNVVVDSPPGLVGNPNAIPFEQRCDISTFEASVCPDSATVGTIGTLSSLVDLPPEEGGPTGTPAPSGWIIQLFIDAFDTSGWGETTKLSLLKTDPEVPAKIGIYVPPPFGFEPIRQVLEIQPDTDGLLQLRTLALEIPRILRAGTAGGGVEAGDPLSGLRIDRLNIRFWGELPNGNAFMTNPTSCEKWTTKAWTRAWYVNDNADADPLRKGSSDYHAANDSTLTPDCTNQSSIPFPITGNVALSVGDRDTSPAFDFTITDPGIFANGQVSTTPKRIQTIIPASINVDVQQLGRNCLVAQFNADQCPAGSRVGSVMIETPLLLPGLKGDVYLVKRDGAGLPDLGLRLRGAITFTQRGQNRYVGPNNNQIETTFDNIPQLGFSKLHFHLDGGANGLLRTLACPTYNKEPAVPSFSYAFTAWTGASTTTTTPLNMKNCFGIQKLKPYRKCLHSMLPVHPDYQSRTRVKRVTLKVDGKQKAQRRNSPFRFDLPLKKLKLKQKKKHKLELRAVYDDGTVSKKQTTFKVCRR